MQRFARRRDAGVTLIEMLVVLAILGLLMAVTLVPINSYWQRSRLESAAGDIRSFLQSAYTVAGSRHCSVTVTMQLDAGGKWELQLTPTQPQADPPPPSWTYVLPDYLSLAYNPGEAAGGWPKLGSARVLNCDLNGRTLCPAGATGATGECIAAADQQVRETKTLSITHASMADGSLTPNIRYDIQLFPLWSVTNRKVLL